MTRGQVTGGHIAVDLFFIISGFLITASFERSKTIFSYLKKRVYRIYPAFFFVMLFETLIVLPLGHGSLPGLSHLARSVYFIKQTLTLQDLNCPDAFPANPYPGVLNGSLWSISFEFWCYIGIIFLGLTGWLRNKPALLLLFATTITISVLFSIFQWNPGGKILGRILGYPPFWARLLPMYLAGVVFYRMRQHLSIQPLWVITGCLSLVAAALIPHGWPLLFPITGAYLILVLAYHPRVRFHDWSRFGDFSYGTYLYAFPVQQLIMSRFPHVSSPLLLFLLAAPVTLACAAVSWHAVEKWFLQRVHPSVNRAVLPAAA